MSYRYLILALFFLLPGLAAAQISLQPLGTYSSGIFDDGGAEIGAYDPSTRRIFVVNGSRGDIDILDINNPEEPRKFKTINLDRFGNGANSVDIHDGLLAVAIQADEKTDPGVVAFFDTNGKFLKKVTVGALPDMLTFTPDGTKVLVANEAEPNDEYTVDPEGSISIIDVSAGIAAVNQLSVKTAGFGAFNSVNLDPAIRVFGPNATPAKDFEPEYIAISSDSRTAWVTLQENNAFAILDIPSNTVTSIVPLGFKSHGKRGNGIDASDEDGKIRIRNWPVRGLYMPDAIASYTSGGETFLVTANEGDARDYDGFSEEERIEDLSLDPSVFPNAEDIKEETELGRLNVTTASGDIDGDGDYDALYSFGARSFSIWNSAGKLVFDSGDDLEAITANADSENFNSDNTENGSFDGRSDNKGPEPEGITIAKISGKSYAFICLERVGGIVIYDISNPRLPVFSDYINPRNFSGDPETGTAGDLGPESMVYIPSAQSPIARPLLIVMNEISGTTTIYKVVKKNL